MKAKTFKRGVVMALLASAVMQATPSYAQPVSTNLMLQAEELESKIQQLDNRIIESMVKVEELNVEMKKQKSKIKVIEDEIQEAEKLFEAHKTVYFDRVRVLQQQGSPFWIYTEIILNSNGFSDFINRTSAIAQFIESDQEILNGIIEKEAELKAKKDDLDKELASLEKNKEELDKEQASIEIDKEKVEAELAKTKDKIKKEEEARKRAEEEARKRAEEEARQRAEREVHQRAEQQRAEQQAPQLAHSTPALTNTPSLSNTNVSSLPYSSNKAQTVISNAYKYLGTPYVWGGTSPSGFDCSGLTQYVYRSVGVELPRVSRDQQNFGTSISPSQVQPGDLVFKGSPAFHVGIYIGNGQYLHAPQTGDVVKIASYNPSAFTTASRVLR